MPPRARRWCGAARPATARGRVRGDPRHAADAPAYRGRAAARGLVTPLQWDTAGRKHKALVASLPRCTSCLVPVALPTSTGECLQCLRRNHPKGDRHAPGGLQPIREKAPVAPVEPFEPVDGEGGVTEG